MAGLAWLTPALAMAQLENKLQPELQPAPSDAVADSLSPTY
jgi:hypothetical protein